MNRVAVALSLMLATSGCVVRAVSPPPPAVVAPAPAPRVLYYGEHAFPDGGWCYAGGPHEHDFYPDMVDRYVFDGGYYYWRAPVVVAYYAGHPLPGHGWCGIAGPHHHDYPPPRDSHWSHVAGRGYVYRGPYSVNRPPPTTYWARPAPAPAHWRDVRATVPAPVRPGPVAVPARASPPVPRSPTAVADWQRDRRPPSPPRALDPARSAPVAPGNSANAPGHGARPPGHGGTPPGLASGAPAPVQASRPNASAPPRNEKRDRAEDATRPGKRNGPDRPKDQDERYHREG